MILLLRQT